ncbi:hypothetical protein C0J52_22381 [Blattella germanica]|nr:hypothetical protein C0J52_22381 [Blattella germanica]
MLSYDHQRRTMAVTVGKEDTEKDIWSNIVLNIKQERIRWAGHVQRMSETRIVKSIFIGKLEGRQEGGGEEDPGKDGMTMLRKTLEKLELDAGEGKPMTGMCGGV